MVRVVVTKNSFCRGLCTVNFANGPIRDTVPGSHAYLFLQGGARPKVSTSLGGPLAQPRRLVMLPMTHSGQVWIWTLMSGTKLRLQ